MATPCLAATWARRLRPALVAVLVVLTLVGHDALMAAPSHRSAGHAATGAMDGHGHGHGHGSHTFSAGHPEQCGVGHEMAWEPAAKLLRHAAPSAAPAAGPHPRLHGLKPPSDPGDGESPSRLRAWLQVYRI